MKGRIEDVAFVLIEQELEGEQIDQALIKNVLDVFTVVGEDGSLPLYENFEAQMLRKIASHYSRKASIHILVDSLSEYLSMVEKCLERDKENVCHYLLPSSEEKLMEKIVHELLFVHANQLLEKENRGFRILLQDGEVENKDIVELLETSFVTEVIKLHKKYLGYVTSCFMNQSLFQKALSDAFMVFCNKSVAGVHFPILLAAYSDNIPKKGGANEKLSDDAIEEALEKIVKLLVCVYEKDLFIAFCQRKLAHRLLFDRGANDDHEKCFLTKLKQQCGTPFTSKMEGMVMDLTIARENQQLFENYLQENPHENPGFGLKVIVLNTGFWPSYKLSTPQLPAEMARNI